MPTRQIKQLFLALVIILTSFIETLGSVSKIDSISENYWRSFRNVYPYHYQTLAISEPSNDGKRILIISEPPSDFIDTEKILKTAFEERLNKIEKKRHKIGYDGWVEDIIVTLVSKNNAEIDRKYLLDNIDFLSRQLFGTTYKSYTIHLPIKSKPPYQNSISNLFVNAYELKSWVIDSNMKFISVYGGEKFSVQHLLDKGKTGVYHSEEIGIIILIIPRNQDLINYRVDFRIFSLDSDLILGAITKTNKNIAIIARERQSSLDEIPPLRFESIIGLAEETETELAQSYERSHIVAGKILDGENKGRDWAPIYLSENLIDTEFGSLLNITDQILKSWSEAGNIEYINFDYPKPSDFPFGKDCLSELSEGSSTLYNWNTSGVGEVFSDEAFEIFSLIRTGSLPVTYGSDANIPGVIDTSKLTKYEEKAYNYFSSLGDNNLIRVVQYTSLYQIFQAFPVKASSIQKPSKTITERQSEKYLADQIYSILLKIIKGDAKIQPSWLNMALNSLDNNELEEIDQSRDKDKAKTVLAFAAELTIKEISKILSELQEIGDEKIIFHLSEYLANPRRFKISSDSFFEFQGYTPDQFEKEIKLNKDLQYIVFMNLSNEISETIQMTSDISEICNGFTNYAKYQPSSYIKTPSIVLSWDTKNVGIGGHNLDSTVTRILTNSKVKPGSVSIAKNRAGKDILFINPKDVNGSGRLARLFSRNRQNPQVQKILENAIIQKQPVRDIKQALYIDKSKRTRGLTFSTNKNVVFDENLGFKIPNESKKLEHIKQIKSIVDEWGYDVVVDKIEDGYLIFHGYQSSILEAKTTPALIEIIGKSHIPLGRKSVNMYFRNFNKNEIKALTESAEIRQVVAAGSEGGGIVPPKGPMRTRLFAFGDDGGSGGKSSGGKGGKPTGNGGGNSSGGKERGYSVNVKNNNLIILSGRRNFKHNWLKADSAVEARFGEKPSWSEAKITEAKVIQSSNNKGITSLEYEVVLPVRKNNKSILLEIKTSFMNFKDYLVEKGKAVIQKFSKNAEDKNMKLTPNSLEQLKLRLENELKPDDLKFFLREIDMTIGKYEENAPYTG
jgi:uncharacterized membrane protein YgcG